MMKYRRTLLLLACILFFTDGSPEVAEAGTTSWDQSSELPTTTAPQSSALSQGSATLPGPIAVQQVPEATTLPSTPIAAGAELTLERAISVALQYHPRIRETAENVNAAAARVAEARSYLGPQALVVGEDLGSTFNGIGNANYYDPEGAFPRMTGRNHDLPSDDFTQSSDINNNYMGGLAVSQFLFDFGRRRGFVSQRGYEAASVSAAEQLAKLDLIFEVSQRYFGVLQDKQLIRVYEKALEQRQYHLHEAQVKATAGLRPQLDVYVTQAEVERAQLYLVDARNAYGDAKVALNNALGLSERAPEYHLADILTYSPVTETVHPLIATALRLRPDMNELEDQAKALGAQIVQYKSDNYPTINALGGYSAIGTGLPAANNFNIGVVITWPIFNSFLTTDQIAEVKARQRSAQYAIQDLQQQIILQVQTAFLDWQASLQRIELAQKALAASGAELELAEKRYEAGLSNIVELEDAQRHYTSDDAAYASALYGWSVTKAAVDKATGRSLAEL
ncbi:MAG: TolC family protein [Candidatus Binataceae bacterium]